MFELNFKSCAVVVLAVMSIDASGTPAEARDLQRLQYNHPGLIVDLGVGLWAWPLPMDYDQDGDMDLLVSCPDKPYNGIYFFENVEGKVKMPVFRPGVRIAAGHRNIQLSYVGDRARVLLPGVELVDFRPQSFGKQLRIFPRSNLLSEDRKIRANQWKYADFDADNRTDLLAGVGDWTEYGWDDAFDENGAWTRGPLRGWVFVIRNVGSESEPQYAEPVKLKSGGKPIEVFGMPSPNLADFDGDGDLDLICGEFLDSFTFFENVGTRREPEYSTGRKLTYNGEVIRMDLQMILPAAVDWDDDDDVDLVVGDEDGRVAFVENTGVVRAGLPQFLPPRYFQQVAAEVKFGALATPVGADWDGDGDEDILSGNTAGYIGFIENLSAPGEFPPRWAKPRLLSAGGEVIRIQAGYNGSIQGPCEAKWGYTTLTVADWDRDGLSDLVVNSIWGKVLWFRNVGTRSEPTLAAAMPVKVAWPGTPPKPEWNWWNPRSDELVTQWRTTPVAVDWNQDGLTDLVMLDHEGFLTLWARSKRSDGTLILNPPERVFVDPEGLPLRLNDGYAGRSGRRKLTVVDWNRDGLPDILLNSSNADLLLNQGLRDGKYVMANLGPVAQLEVAGHTSSPTTVDWNADGIPDLLLGAEDGYFYYMEHPADE